MGVEPSRIVDLLALKGDSVDNIPGAPGIGDKGARDLISTYGSVEGAIEHADEVKRKTYRESLQNNSEQILLSKKLATLATDAPVDLDLEALKAAEPALEPLRALYKDLEFNSLLSQLDQAPEPEVATELHTFASAEAFEDWIARLPPDATLSIAVDLQRPDAEIETDPGGVAFCADPAAAFLLPAAHVSAAKSFLEDPTRPKRFHDAKSAEHALGSGGIALAGVVDDTMLTAFLANPTRAGYSLEKTSGRHFGATVDAGAGSAAAVTARLGTVLSDEIDRLDLRDLYERIELPLAAVLARVERAGIQLDRESLAELSDRLEQDIEKLSAEIHTLAGEVFNIKSE